MQWEKLSETIQIAINDAHRFGTDAFLLEHFAAVRGIDTVCDLCAGCGIIGLLMLRRDAPNSGNLLAHAFRPFAG